MAKTPVKPEERISARLKTKAKWPVKPEDRISARNGGKVPLAYWQKSFQIDVIPDPTAPYVSKIGKNTYIDTRHPEYTRWLVGFVKGAANAVDQALKRGMN